jgi:hypothetical protein
MGSTTIVPEHRITVVNFARLVRFRPQVTCSAIDGSTLPGAAVLRLLEAVEEPAGVRAGKRIEPVRLPFLDGVARGGSAITQVPF